MEILLCGTDYPATDKGTTMIRAATYRIFTDIPDVIYAQFEA